MPKVTQTQYRDVPGFPGYRVGDDGSVWSRWRTCPRGKFLSTWRRMKTPPSTKGYPRCNLSRDGKAEGWMVHHIVLTTFVGPCPEGLECRHLDGVKTNCRLGNLKWGTTVENADDRKRHRNFGPHVRLYTINGETEPLKEWSRRLGIPYLCLYKRIFTLGMTFEEAIARPYQGTSSNGYHWTDLKRRNC